MKKEPLGPSPAEEPEGVRLAWDAIVRAAPGLTPHDRPVVLEAARVKHDLETARAHVVQHGPYAATKTGAVVETPQAVRERRCRDQYLRIAKQLGIG